MIQSTAVAQTSTLGDLGETASHTYVVEQVSLLASEAWEKELDDAALKLRSRPGLLVDIHGARQAVAVITVPLHLVPMTVSPRVSTNWTKHANALFPNARYMTPEERTDFDRMSRQGVQPLSKPLKRLS